MLANAESRQLVPTRFANSQRTSANSPRVGIVKDNDSTVGGESQIALDATTAFKRGRKGDQAVLRKARAGMQAAVGEPTGPRIEWVRP